VTDLVTGEAVPLEMRLAKFPSRALAITIDLVVLFVVALVFVMIIGALAPELDQALGSAVTLTFGVALLVGVPVGVETLTRGRSLGKLALGLRVVRDDGGPIRFRHALTRGLAGFFVDFYTTLGVGAVVSSLLSERGKRIGDLLAGTVVIRERAPSYGGPLPAVPPQLAAWATGLELSRLPDDLALNARTFLTRSYEMAPAVREQMAASLATEIAHVVTPPAPPGTPAWAYLAAVLSERGRRHAQQLAAQQGAAQQAGAAQNAFGTTQPAPPTPIGPPPGVSAEPPAPPRDPPGRGFAPPG
jgi:uncharacterized RDD family membrane protein YckC